MCSNLTIKTLERHHWLRSGVFIVNLFHISCLTHFTPRSRVFIVNFEHVIAGWDICLQT